MNVDVNIFIWTRRFMWLMWTTWLTIIIYINMNINIGSVWSIVIVIVFVRWTIYRFVIVVWFFIGFTSIIIIVIVKINMNININIFTVIWTTWFLWFWSFGWSRLVWMIIVFILVFIIWSTWFWWFTWIYPGILSTILWINPLWRMMIMSRRTWSTIIITWRICINIDI